MQGPVRALWEMRVPHQYSVWKFGAFPHGQSRTAVLPGSVGHRARAEGREPFPHPANSSGRAWQGCEEARPMSCGAQMSREAGRGSHSHAGLPRYAPFTQNPAIPGCACPPFARVLMCTQNCLYRGSDVHTAWHGLSAAHPGFPHYG